MNKKNLLFLLIFVAMFGGLAFAEHGGYFNFTKSTSEVTETVEEEVEEVEEVTPYVKSPEAKQAVMEADAYRMESLGLSYDYANMSLVEVVQAFADDNGIDHSDIAFSYKNTETNEMITYNETQPMTAGSTYKLAVNMLVVDAIEEGKLSYDERYDITQLSYENASEYQAYRNQFGDDMSIDEMQTYSLVYSENTPAYALVSLLGDRPTAYAMMEKYGVSANKEVPTISDELGNVTTTDFYIKVLDYLWKHQDKYEKLIELIDESFTGQYYETYLGDIKVAQKPGFVSEALNVDALVYEETPYLIALYTRYLGNSNEYTTEVDSLGYSLFLQLSYVINEWHRVNQNP